MKYLLDTCVVSELVKPKPSPSVTGWIGAQDELHFCLSVLTFGELMKGIYRLKDAARKRRLLTWVERDLMSRFSGRIIPVTQEIANRWGRISAGRELSGNPLPVVDGLLAATALIHHLTFVTRNVRHIAVTGVHVLDPWEEVEG